MPEMKFDHIDTMETGHNETSVLHRMVGVAWNVVAKAGAVQEKVREFSVAATT